MFKMKSTKVVYTDPWMSLRQDTVIFPNGKEGTHTVVERKHGAFVLLHNPQNEVLLVKQYRYPIQSFDWGLPGGGIDNNESPSEGAIRELHEEVGIQLSDIELIGTFYALSPLSTEKIYLFFGAIDNIKPKLVGESDEQMTEVLVIPIQKAVAMIDTNEITDTFTANALQSFYRQVQIK